MDLSRNLWNNQWSYLQLLSSWEKFPGIAKLCCWRERYINIMLMYAVSHIEDLNSHRSCLPWGHHLSFILVRTMNTFSPYLFNISMSLKLVNHWLTEILSVLGFYDGIFSSLALYLPDYSFLSFFSGFFFSILSLNFGVLLHAVMGPLLFPSASFHWAILPIPLTLNKINLNWCPESHQEKQLNFISIL